MGLGAHLEDKRIMQIDWEKTLDEILAERMACPRCTSLTEELFAGYTRETWGTDYAPRCQFCVRKEDCDARKLAVLCEACAKELGLRARRVDQSTLMGTLLADCRKDLEESLDYLTEYWQEDLNIPPEAIDRRLEEFDQEVFADEEAARRRLEDEYLTYHRWFRERSLRIPDAAWRANYVEDIRALGYETLLGD